MTRGHDGPSQPERAADDLRLGLSMGAVPAKATSTQLGAGFQLGAHSQLGGRELPGEPAYAYGTAQPTVYAYGEAVQ